MKGELYSLIWFTDNSRNIALRTRNVTQIWTSVWNSNSRKKAIEEKRNDVESEVKHYGWRRFYYLETGRRMIEIWTLEWTYNVKEKVIDKVSRRLWNKIKSKR